MRRIRRIGKWVWYGLLLVGMATSGVAWSVREDVGPVAAWTMDIGDAEHPLRPTYHQFFTAWEREHGQMQQPVVQSSIVQPKRPKYGITGCTRKSVATRKVSAKVPDTFASVPLPQSWRASLIQMIAKAHLDKNYFHPPAPPIEMIARD